MRDRLLHLTDFHFWEIVRNPLRLMNKRAIGNLNVILKRRHDFLTDRVESYSEYVSSLGICDALLTGDFASTSTPLEFGMGRRFVEGLERRGLRPVVIPGNHDVYTFESVRKKRFEHYFATWLPRHSLPCSISLPGGTPLVLVPTVRPNFMSSQGFIDPGTIEKVGQLLRAIDGPAIVAAHYPLLHVANDYVAPYGRRLLNAEALRKTVASHRFPVLYVAGHNHRFFLGRDETYSNLTHLTTGSFFWRNERAGTEGEFTDLAVEPSQVRVSRHVFRRNWAIESVEKIGF